MEIEEVKPKKKIAKRQSRFRLALSGFNKKYIDEAVDFWLSRGADPMLISGIFGNISQESNWDPLADSSENGLGDFYGLVLMSKDMRKEVKRVYGKVDSNTTHLFIYDAMTGNKKISLPWRNYMKLKGGYWNNTYHDPGTAAMAFGTVFERPKERYADWNERMRSALDAYDYITQIINTRNEAEKQSFANPIKTTVSGDGNKTMTVNPEYWEQQGMLKPVLTELPVQQSVITAPAKKVAPRIENVAPAPWDLNQLALDRGIESTPQKSPFSLRLRLPSLTSLLQLNSPEELAKQYFADALGISDMLPYAPSLFPKLKDGKLPKYEDGTPVKVDGYDVYPSAIGASELSITTPEVVVTGKDRRPAYQKYDAEHSTYDPNAIREFTDVAPIVGDIGQGLDAYNAFKNKDYAQAGILGGMLLLPNVAEKPLKLGYKLLDKTLNYTLDPLAKKVAPYMEPAFRAVDRFWDNRKGWSRVAHDVLIDPLRVITDYSNGNYPLTFLLRRDFVKKRADFYNDVMNFADAYEVNLRNKRLMRHGEDDFFYDNESVRPSIRTARNTKPAWNGSRIYYEPSNHRITIPTRTNKNSNFSDYASPEKWSMFNHEYTHALLNSRNSRFAPYLSISKWDPNIGYYVPDIKNIKTFDGEYNPYTNAEDWFNVVTRAKLNGDLNFFDRYEHSINADEWIANGRAIELTPGYEEKDFFNTYTDDVQKELLDEKDRQMSKQIGYKDGKSPIRIKPANKGKLTRLKKRTGKSEAELYRTGSAATRKMITFARNARKWKH